MSPIKAICFLVFLFALHISHPAICQTNDQGAQPPAPAAPSAPATPAAPAGTPAPPAPAATQETPAPPATALLKPAELDALVAPIALYPDTLLANVLMAATYPLEIVRAERWLKDNSKLQGEPSRQKPKNRAGTRAFRAALAEKR